MKLKGLVSGVAKNADKLGMITGFLLGSDNPSTDLSGSLANLLKGQVHFPDPAAITHWADTYLPPAIMAYAGGLVLDALNIPVVKGLGKPLQNGAAGFAIGSLALHVLYGATHSDEGSNPNSPNYRGYGRGAESFIAQAPAYPY